MQDNQVRSAMGYNDFKGLIQKENEAFSGHIVSEEQNAVCWVSTIRKNSKTN